MFDVETIKVYKGSNEVVINKTDVDEWRKNGYETSSDRQSKAKKKTSKEDK
jgi:hypothetical protein